jgi:hypothetical protein
MEQSYQNYKNVLHAKMKNLLDDYGHNASPVGNPMIACAGVISPPPNIKSPVIPINVRLPQTTIQQSESTLVLDKRDESGSFYDVLIWVIIIALMILLGYMAYFTYIMCKDQSCGSEKEDQEWSS